MPSERPLLKKTLIISVTGLVILAGLLVGAVRLVDTFAPRYRQSLTERIGDRIGATVRADALDLHWSWSGPVLWLENVVVAQPGAAQPALRLSALGLHFSLLDLIRGQRLPDGLRLQEPRFGVVVHDDRSVSIMHWPSSGRDGFGWHRVEQARATLDFMAVQDARIDIVLASRPAQPKPARMRIDDLDMTLRDRSETLTATLSARAEGWLADLRVDAAITGTLPDFTRARLEVDADNLNTLQVLRAVKPPDSGASLSGGAGDLRLTAYWRQHRFNTASARLKLDAIRAASIGAPLLPGLEATLSARRDPEHEGVINISLDTLSGALPGLKAIRASARVETAENTVTVRARNLPATLAAAFARLRFDALADVLADARIDGMIDTVEAAFDPEAPARLALAFDRLRIETPALAAGPVSGQYYHQGEKNLLTFTRAGGVLRAGRYLRGALPVAGLSGQLGWHPARDGWQLRATDLQLTSGESTLAIDGGVRLSGQSAPVADLNAKLYAPDIARLLAHIPQTPGLPFDRLRDWLPKAIRTGRIEATARLSGPLDQIFAGEGRHFSADIQGRGMTVAYKPEWPPLTGARGKITMQGDTLVADIQQGEILGVTVGPATAQVENVREPVLFLDGTVTDAAANRMMSFLAKSPLADRFGTLVDALDVGGTADLSLDLRVPLKSGLGDIKVSGVIHAQGNTLAHNALPAPVEAITGQIAFDRGGLQAENLRGRLMGLELITDIEPGSSDKLSIVSRTQLALPEHRELLAQYVPQAWLDYARGRTAAQINLQIDTDGRISNLTINSPLDGMALELPPPLNKPAGTTVPLVLRLAEAGQLTLDYGDQLHVDMALDDGRLQRAAALFGVDPAIQAPPGPGLWLGGSMQQLNAIAWFDVINTIRNADNESGADDSGDGLAFRGADLEIADLHAGTRQLRNVRLHAEPLDEGPGWRFDIAGPDARGRATWRPDPDGRGLLSARFSLLKFTTIPSAANVDPDTGNADAAAADAASKDSRILAELSPEALPNLNIDIARLSVAETDFGTVTVDAAGLSHGWLLNRVQISGGALNLLAGGRWTRTNGLTQAALDVRIDGRGLASLMRTLGYNAAIKAETVALRTQLNIAPNDNGLDLQALNGELALELTDGTLQSIEPGAGRLLGLFNLYVLPRRIMLDFSDVVDQGLAFDKISGSFNIVSGNAYTDNLTIQTPSATIHIDGRIGLAARDYDETVTIEPKFGSSLTLAGAVLGGPVVGAAVFAIQQLLEEPIQEASSISYKLQGSWDDPRIVDPSVRD